MTDGQSYESILERIKHTLSSNETMHGLLKIAGNLVLAAIISKFALIFYQQGNTLIATVIGIMAFIVFVIAIGYLVICVARRFADTVDFEPEKKEHVENNSVLHNVSK
jgi:hypothetical protein